MSDTLAYVELPAGLRPMINEILDTARQALAKDGFLQPLAMVFNTASQENMIIDLSAPTNAGIVKAAETVRLFCDEIDANMVVSVMETWGLPMQYVHLHKTIVNKYGSVGQSPYRIDIFSIHIETSAGIWVGQSPILRASGRLKRRFGNVQYVKPDNVIGTLGNYLAVHRGESHSQQAKP